MRFKVIRLAYQFILILIALRLFYWQIIMSDDLTVMAEKQHLKTTQIEGPRGQILYSDGSILASNQPVYELYGQPKVIEEKDKVANLVAKIISPKDSLKVANEIKDKLAQNLYWVALYKNLSVDLKNQIEELKIKGLGFNTNSARFYPESSASAQLLGFIGSDDVGNKVGYFGIEGFYNKQLRGTSGTVIQERDGNGLPILSGKFFQKKPLSGYNLVLNIDRAVQHMVEIKLKSSVEKFAAKSGSVVVIEPKSGNVLAMATFPNYDPGSYQDFPKEVYLNPIVAETYEPGSTFKVIVMSMAINDDLLKADTKCDICSGPLQISGHLIRTWNNKYNSDVNMTDVIVHSDNTGMVFVSRKLGLDKMYEYINNFGFGLKTNIDLQEETSSSIRPKKEWREIDLATSSFGQGIAVTPMQMVRAVGVIASGGMLMEPHIVSQIQIGGETRKIQPRIMGNPISAEATKVITEMMVQAVDRGEAQFYKKRAGLQGYKIAGKTGTAQIPVAGYYDENKTVASFVGFAPAADPKFVMLVKYNEPTSSIYGADTAAPTFFEIAKELFLYYNIPPSE
ncbi:hypothetical protein A3H85_03925 [Candidatus Daviesbacteria bacterium RIFCSPLOWO2_02_FULL_40_8]|uniref:Penicillin-binding protein transpeptidase domain-containing protein n=1 Tax=Candidatus Daviesbacteria bacterium RIFCSPLOWO2_01_FULL_40_24 TaxID=1797787 RepID=A0A1F5MJ58_9BACT|nr:MAG: hypothetical protein A3C32_04075 [Candidatus Daviesbacteria bacterium RIFCSPHIGHO2_02_FULL_41_14]OGE65404.1 MAG: hypothetical protein A3B49_00770 [Candidatus Daviesbacteria bacterium RIFCSPLOWO2_01_FULL_40_24]OGE65900.1 MAG: hypothetical protein A3H85_03925 [Candidatus Daviesbacteria bacterium RIFCSPLOWO2_02_FULL_40_8]